MRLFNNREIWDICLNVNMDVKCYLDENHSVT